MKVLFAIPAFTLLVACASIEHKTSVVQPMGVERTAGIGDVVLRTMSEKSLPNAFGGADIFGRTTPTAQTTVVFEGTHQGKVIFSRRSMDIDTGATTMNSTPLLINPSSTTFASGQVGGTPFAGTSTTSGSPIVLPPNTPRARVTERNRNVIAIEASELPKSFVLEGVTVRVLSADDLQVRYVLESAR